MTSLSFCFHVSSLFINSININIHAFSCFPQYLKMFIIPGDISLILKAHKKEPNLDFYFLLFFFFRLETGLHIPASLATLLKCLVHNTVKKKSLLIIQRFESAAARLILTAKREKVIDSVSADKMPLVIFSDISLC